MKTIRFLTVFGILFLALGLFSSSAAFAQVDGCCISQKSSENDAQTAALIADKMNCNKGKEVDRGFKACSWTPDPENNCSQNTAEKRCGSCGFHWSGSRCFVKDPVAIAKKKLEEEQKAKEEAKKK